MSELSTPSTSLSENKDIKDTKQKKCDPNWLPSEEEKLAKSWLHISQYPETSVNQTGDMFYSRVSEHFNGLSKWLAINNATLKFSAIYNSITNSPPSGSSPLDWMKMEEDLYQAINKGTPFKLGVACDALCYAPKWAQEGQNEHQEYVKCSLKKSTSSTPSSSD
ncbi:hypothetical protein O181_035139 [Austropuccinia psidii MF-1]|uniref:Uncharacterized protein n=1 Tax=Austropuccinia psidii MF-1 TaxID=1389203 RepID=A0A9Q3D234_9BASI|nr:hypothetical protein [Austropuccinia psidii MF-1]